LEQCPTGGTGWGELRRQQRFLQRLVEAELKQLARFTRFVTLIEQGYTRDDAYEAVLRQQDEGAAAVEEEGAHAEEPTDEPLREEVAAARGPRREGQPLRQALFAQLSRLFDPR
jgi:hypothetical protein